MEKEKWHTTPCELSRTYVYPDHSIVFIRNLNKLKVSDSGTHYLEYDGTHKAIVAPGWTHILIEADEWDV
jgi:hypothetical protein